MLKIRISLSAITLALVLSSCNLINPPEEIPALIRIDTIFVHVDQFDQGSASHQMNNVWISVGGKNLGVFELPALIPCMETGPQWVFIRPGIKLNGIAASRAAYSFYEAYELNDFNLESGVVTTINPVTTYKKECVFAWMEDFEDAGVTFNYASYSDTVFRNQKDSIKEGRFSGAVYLDRENRYFEATSSEDFELPSNGTLVLLEFDYMNDLTFEVGTYVIKDEAATWNSLVFIRPMDRWNRIYVDLYSTAMSETDADLFRMGFRAAWDSTGRATQGILMDNIKLIHF